MFFMVYYVYLIWISLFILFVIIYLFLNKFSEHIFGSKSKKDKKYKTVCPKCGSTDIKVDFSNPVVWDYGAPSNYQCASCGHISNVFPLVSIDKIKLYGSKIKHSKFRSKKEPLLDVKTGIYAFYLVIILWFIFCLIFLILGIYWMALLMIVLGIILLNLRNKNK
jgi:hypothetical protein